MSGYSTLDHNNMAITLKKPTPPHMMKPQKTLRPPPVRQFPTNKFDQPPPISKSKTLTLNNSKGIISNLKQSVSFEQLERDSNELNDKYVNIEEDLKTQVRMRDTNFLKIDQSKIPLEMFDNIDYSSLDKSPGEWLASKSGGKTPFYLAGEWTWARVEVLGFDQEKCQYVVQHYHEDGSIGVRKFVHRLNLQFDQEEEKHFLDRRRVAELARSELKQVLRMDHYASELSKDLIRTIGVDNIRRIHQKVIDGLPPTIPFPDQGTMLGYLLRSITGEVISWYNRVMKKTVVHAKLQGPYKDIELYSKYINLDLALPQPHPKAPANGKIPCPFYPFGSRISRIESLNYTSINEVLQIYRYLHEEWLRRYQYYNFVDISIIVGGTPCTVKEFNQLQEISIKKTMSCLNNDFRRAFLDNFCDCLQEIYDFYQSNLLVYGNGSLHKLFKVFDFRLSDILRRILLESLESWKSLIVRFTTQLEFDPTTAKRSPLTDEESAALISHNADLQVGKIKGNIKKRQPLAYDASRYCRNIKYRKSEYTSPLYVRASLFQIELVIKDDKVVLEPSIDIIKAALTKPLHDIVEGCRSITSVEYEIMSLIQKEILPILNVGVEDPLFADLDLIIKNNKQSILDKIDLSMIQPLALANDYNDFMWLMATSVEEYIENIKLSQPLLEDYEAEFFKLENAARDIEDLSFNNEYYSLVCVTTTRIRTVLLDKAKIMSLELSTVVLNQMEKENLAIVERYKVILQRIAVKPINEKELSDLRDFIEFSRTTVIEIKNSAKETKKLLTLLDKYRMNIPIDDLALSWSTLEFPSRVEIAGKEMEVILESDKIKMMDRLALQKEQFDIVLKNLGTEVQLAKLFDGYDDYAKIVEQVNSLMDNIQESKLKGIDFNMREKVFFFQPTDYFALEEYESELSPFAKLWNMISDFYNSKNDWLHGDFVDLEGEKIELSVTDWWKTSYKLSKDLEDNFPGASKCARRLREETTEFRKHLPVIQSLASKALKRRHWEQLSELLGKIIDPEDELTLQGLLDLDVALHIEAIQEITVAAEKEYSLERNLSIMIKEWEAIDFEVKIYKESGTFIVGGIEDIVTLLDDHLVKTQTMRGSPYIKPIEKECKDWEFKLKYAQVLLDAIISCQRTWMYLEPIFGSEDIMRQLPTEARRFVGVDTLWRKTMGDVNDNPNFMNISDPANRLEEKFRKANEKLEQITKGLNDYLEMKRLYFPRFFFLSNDELLEILSQTKEPRAVQPHLGKCFEGINKVKFEEDLKITEFNSAEGEVIKMSKPVDPDKSSCKGNVEMWLLELESVQWDSVRDKTKQCLDEYEKVDRKVWMLNWPAQCVLGISCVYWTAEVSKSLLNGGGANLKTSNNKFDKQLLAMVELVRGKLTKLQRRTLGALTTIDVHNRDVVAKMVELDTRDVTDFTWISQFRYYWEESWRDGQAVKKGENTLVARIVNARCLYGYEYLGNTMRLVITALTDRCYRTMVGAIDLLYGGAPEGPAGTGKTETVKDLSKAVAIHCVVFNCSDGLDYLAMAKFFKGLAGCGSWCCFDEFNRINIEVLSVIAQQILQINHAKRENRAMFHFEGTYMKLNANCNVFITMNPGYAGRAELPDNLKALFRPCAMMVPDYAMIGEIRLYSFGFGSARENAQKIVRVLQLSSEQLSSQKHYDYGMRAVNSILVACGNLREQLGNDPNWTEAKITLRSINDVNLAKFLVEDLPLFHGITSDLFPGIHLPNAEYGSLLPCLENVCSTGIEIAEGNTYVLEAKDTFINKSIQLYEMVLVRHGVMVVGQTCSGKTAIIHNLAKGMSLANTNGDHSFEKVQIFNINPKSVTSGQLYGLFDENTHEFVDGILAVTFRHCAKDTSPDRKWMMFDGPVDAVWIENMNTVLDDNKKLCLTSGEIIKMSDTMTMFFEAEDLEQASPATVSRVGMIFCESRNIGWQAVRNIWLKTLPKEFTNDHLTQLKKLFDWHYPVLTYFVSKFCKLPYVLTPQILIFSVTRILTSMFQFAVAEKGDKDRFKQNTTGACEFPADVEKFIDGCFIYAMIWSVGVSVDSNGRKKFDAFIRLLLKGEVYSTPEYIDFKVKTPEYKYDDGTKKMSTSFPDEGLVYDYNFDRKRGIWMNWFDGFPIFKIPRESSFNSIVVPTIDTIRNEWLLETLLVNGFHVLCTGETGTGKSVCIKNKLFSGMPEQFNSISLNFSARTSANQAQDAIDSKLDKRRKGVLGPPLGVKTVVFVDDLNMPAKEIYGAQPPIEILRQWMDHRGWYDRKENEFRKIVDVQFCAAMGPAGGGRTRITQRYVRHFNVINFVNFSDESLTRVFSTILEWRFQQGFPSAIQKLSKQTIDATIMVYNQLSACLLPTPLKSHYTFNLRDLSKVFQGILLGDPSLIKAKSEYLRLWSHECMRVFHDRLIDDIDRNWFINLLSTTVKDIFNDNFDKIKGTNNSILFGNFGDAKTTIKMYQELIDRDNLPNIMNYYLTDYNESNTTGMNLVLFESAIEHISRISRIINQPYGNALLVGVGGSGRKSLTTLAVFIAEFQLFKIEITKSYGVFEWREDIKKMMTTAGVDNSPTVFMMDDTQIVNESFLEDINGILNTGEIANLFLPDEWAIIVDNLMKACQEAGVNSAVTTEVYNFFISRVRTNLHLVLCLSPIGEAFRTRLRMFPSLVNCCTIDWFSEWPEDALHMCANHFLKSVELPDNIKSGVVDVCVDMQVRVVKLSKKFLDVMGRHYYVTPTSYLELINTFKSLLSVQRQEVIDGKERYDNGLMKLRETADQVNDMQEYLEDLQPKLKAATIATDALLIRISADRVVANEKSVIVEADAAICNEQAEQATNLKNTCEAELGEALPALKSAEQALKSLDKSDIVEMKAMKKPSAAIKMTMAAICILFKVKPDKKCKDGDPRFDPYWVPATKELLGDSHFLKKLQTFDKDKMEPEVVAKVKVFTDDPDFDSDVVAKKGSVAAAGLARWVHAMVQYERVFRIVAPKKKSLKEAEVTLKIAKAELLIKTNALKEVLDKVASLETALQDAEDTKEKLKNQVIDCEKKLGRADALIQGLGGEKIRWTEMSAKLETKFVNITGDIVISSGLIAYMGAFMSNYREDAIKQWSQLLESKGIPCSSNFNLRDTLGSAIEISGWIIKKLPNDSFSIDNGIMMKRSNRWPLFIDPQLQANKWIKKMEEPNSLKVVKQNQANFVRILENAIQFGNPVILENVPETLDPILECILLKQIVVVGGMTTIRFGDATIEYDKNFRLYITTKLRNPHYPPELCVKVNLLNFMATSEGLQDQMLGRVVALEQKELEAQRLNLVIDDAEYQRILKEVEDKILNMLKNAEGNILDDEVLIDTLGESKKTANLIQEKVKVAEVTQKRISKVRRGYIPVAAQSSQLFFCISDLATVDPMYQYSLEWYISLFETAIETADKAKNLDDRLKNLNQCFTKILYNNVCRSLFEKDKLLFSFLLATKILLGENLLDPIELRFFLQGNTSMDLAEINPYKSWLHDKIWGDILAIKELPVFLPFFELFKLKSNEHLWQEVISSTNPMDVIISIVGDRYNQFQKICILRCIRSDYVVPAIQEFISNNIGARFIEPPTFNMKQCFEDSKCTTPLIFVLTPGAAPMSELYKLAEEMGFESRLVAISLGQGQGPLAENAITDAATKGTWICLQNCHLSISWLPTLEKICEEFNEDSLHPSFRLWLTSEPTEYFPAFVLQNGIKMTNEPPKGMRANLLGSLLQVDETWYETCNRKEEFKKILFGLCFFHAAVRERRKFGPLGWNISYIFSLPDLKISMDQLRIFLDEMRPEDPVPFAALAYLVGECNYGGRVTDDKDRRCIMNILDDFYNPKILNNNYRFSPSGTYYAPVNTNLHLCKEFVRSLPFNEGPEVFGLHDNANITCAISETNLLLDTALSLQPRVQQGEGKSWGDKLDELAQDINIRIPIPFDVEKALITFPVKYEESMNTVLTQELLRFNGLTIEITTTLIEIRKALKGQVVMSSELEEMGNSMVIGKVPNMWSKIAYPSLKPLGSWVFDLLERLAFLREWVDIEESPNVFWISGFFFTQAFITGTLQNFARRHAIPIDKAEFDFRVLKASEMKDANRKKPDDGAYIKGLYLEGAMWNTMDHVLDESLPRELYVEMPYIHLYPKEKSLIPVVKGIPEQYTGATSGTCHMYMCPVYKTSFRQGVLSTTGHSTNFVMMIRIPIAKQHVQKHWIKRGVAMLTQLDF